MPKYATNAFIVGQVLDGLIPEWVANNEYKNCTTFPHSYAMLVVRPWPMAMENVDRVGFFRPAELHDNDRILRSDKLRS